MWNNTAQCFGGTKAPFLVGVCCSYASLAICLHLFCSRENGELHSSQKYAGARKTLHAFLSFHYKHNCWAMFHEWAILVIGFILLVCFPFKLVLKAELAQSIWEKVIIISLLWRLSSTLHSTFEFAVLWISLIVNGFQKTLYIVLIYATENIPLFKIIK